MQQDFFVFPIEGDKIILMKVIRSLWLNMLSCFSKADPLSSLKGTVERYDFPTEPIDVIWKELR